MSPQNGCCNLVEGATMAKKEKKEATRAKKEKKGATMASIDACKYCCHSQAASFAVAGDGDGTHFVFALFLEAERQIVRQAKSLPPLLLSVWYCHSRMQQSYGTMRHRRGGEGRTLCTTVSFFHPPSILPVSQRHRHHANPPQTMAKQQQPV